MPKQLIILCIALQLAINNSYGQDEPGSTASQSAIQAYLEQQNQSSNRFESMARMQVEVQYGDFLNSLGGNPSRRAEAERVLVEVVAERADLSSRASSGQVAPEQLQQISSYEYLRDRLGSVLNSTELLLLDSRQEGMAELQLRRTYLEQMNRIAPDVYAGNQQIVLDVLIEHMLFRNDDAGERNRVTAEELVQQQLMSLLEARVELQDRLEGQ
ncbi:MAG: hypothetical protein GKR91_19695 [Pseudomonadales bacterium]|nr:hypothetical protein [Pseudomonadales bacterium]